MERNGDGGTLDGSRPLHSIQEGQGRDMKVEVFNPHGKDEKELPVIYGFNNGGPEGWMHAQLIAEDGTTLGSHLCSSEGYMPHDLGIVAGSRPDRHEHFRKHYPDGYRMEFVCRVDVEFHEGLNAAIAKHNAINAEESMRLTSVPLIGGKGDGIQVPADSRPQIGFPVSVGDNSTLIQHYERKRLFLDLYVPRDMPADEAASLLLRNYQPAATRDARALLTRLVQLDTEQLRNFSGCELHRLERLIYEVKEFLR